MTIDDVKGTLPPPPALWKTAVGLHVLDRIVGRRFARFALTSSPEHAHLRFEDGGGNTLDAVFCAAGALLVGFDHESPLSPWAVKKGKGRIFAGLLDRLPAVMHPLFCQDGPLYDEEETFTGRLGERDHELPPLTFATWWAGGRWEAGPIAFPTFGDHESDGASFLTCALLEGASWFAEQHDMDEVALEQVLAHEPLDESLIRSLRPEADAPRILTLAREAGYASPYRW